MILTDKQILKEIEQGRITITDFDMERLNPNSYDIRLGRTLLQYKGKELDLRRKDDTRSIEIPDEGYVLKAGQLYLASTIERTETPFHVPKIEGKSSIGRKGLFIHVTAGFGDIGFRGHWTLELVPTIDIRVYAGAKIGQISFIQPIGEVGVSYDQKPNSKYSDQPAEPIASRYHENYPQSKLTN